MPWWKLSNAYSVVPVTGKIVMADGKPLTGAVVSFNHDPAKGNTQRVSSTGRINADGQYEIYTDGGSKVRKRAPLEWYKVTLLTGLPGAPPIQIDSKYLDSDKTTLVVEVVDVPPPNAYNFTVTK